MRVALIVDSPYRDIPSAVLVAHRLCQEGIVSHLVPYNLRWSEIPSLAPDFVLLNQMHKTNEPFVRALVSAGIPFGILDKEGGVLPSIEMYAEAMGDDQTLRDQAEFFCSWGPLLADYVLRSGRYSSRQVRLTGTPRSDFYVEPWRRAALEASGYVERYGTPLVLINGNFPLANPIALTPEGVVAATVKWFGQDQQGLLGVQQRERQLMRGLTALSNRLAREFPTATFVYRPHPFERTDRYQGLLEHLPNLHLVKSGTVEGWILRSKALIQKNCTTGVEAGMVGVPTLSPAWMPDAVKIPSVEAVSIPCGSEEELKGTLREILRGGFEVPTHIRGHLHDVIQDWFYRVDGRAHERVAACILASLNGRDGQGVRLKRCKALAYGVQWPGSTRSSNVLARVRMRLGVHREWSFHRWRIVPDGKWESTDKYFDEQTVRQVSEAIVGELKEAGANFRRRVEVQLARARRDYVIPLHGRSVTLVPALTKR